MCSSDLFPPAPDDGKRYLVETFWPEECETFSLWPSSWLKELAPSYELCGKMEHKAWNPEEFRAAYWDELKQSEKSRLICQLINEGRDGTVTLLYSTSKANESSAYYLKVFLEQVFAHV